MAYFKDNQKTEYHSSFNHDPSAENDDFNGYAPQSYFSAVEDDDLQNPYDADVQDFEEDEEERREKQKMHWRIMAGVANFLSIAAGIIVILILTALLISLITWLQGDMDQSFLLILKSF